MRGGVGIVDVGYAERMSQKDAEEREAFSPRPTRKKKNDYETKWRCPRALYEKVLAVAKVEASKATLEANEIEGDEDLEISVNAQLNFIAQKFIETYEEKFGTLPDAKDDAAVRKYARTAINK